MESKQEAHLQRREARLCLWRARYEAALAAYAGELAAIERRQALYEGNKKIAGRPGFEAKAAGNVRNIVYELIESQVDSSLPMPKVEALHPEDAPRARIVEDLLRQEMQRIRFGALNDLDERTTPVQGGDFYHLEWDSAAGGHCAWGDLRVSLLHPRQVIPQAGAAELEEMDHVFLRILKPRRRLEETYHVKLESAQEAQAGIEQPPESEMATQCIAYYRHKNGVIGRFSWAGRTVLEDLPDYQAPQGEVEKGRPVYRPGRFPLVQRRNISAYGRFLGDSDVDKIADPPEAIKKLGGKIEEKLLKGGSYVTLPSGVGIETSDRELKIIRLETPAQKALIDVYNIQPDVSRDAQILEENYQWAKSTLGISDSFQGKQDRTALSGTAKQIAVQQSAGRLESKRVMKNAAYCRLYEMMFRFWLAYAGQPRPVRRRDEQGGEVYGEFRREDFLKQDAAGELYWADEFLFTVDASATLAANRQAMWQEIRTNYQAGAFGPPAELESALLYWRLLERHAYPGAGEAAARLEERIAAREGTQDGM